MKLALIPTGEVDEIWPTLAPSFEAACRRCDADDLNAGALWQMARKGDGFLIIAYQDCGFDNSKGGKDIFQASIWRFDTPHDAFSLRCMMLFGVRMRLWYGPMWDLITKIALDNGATRLVTKGRIGWLRKCANAKRVESAKRVNNANQINDDYEVDLKNGRL